MMPALDAFEIALSVIENRGLAIEEPIEQSPYLRGFAFPNPLLGGFSQAIISHVENDSLIQVCVRLTQGQVPTVLRDGLLQLMNDLHFISPGVVFTYENDDEDGDELELATWVRYVDASDVALLLEDCLSRLEHILQRSIPLIMTYLTQRLRVKLNSAGDITDVLPTLSVPEVMQMLEVGQFGRA